MKADVTWADSESEKSMKRLSEPVGRRNAEHAAEIFKSIANTREKHWLKRADLYYASLVNAAKALFVLGPKRFSEVQAVCSPLLDDPIAAGGEKPGDQPPVWMVQACEQMVSSGRSQMRDLQEEGDVGRNS